MNVKQQQYNLLINIPRISVNFLKQILLTTRRCIKIKKKENLIF